MADACVSLVEGETLQAAAAKAGKMDQETYYKIIARKTASLFEAAAQMGAILGGASEETVDALARFSFNLGLAFQIVDDVLDIIGDPETMGKPVGNDVSQGAGAIMAQNGRHLNIDTQNATTVTTEVEDPVAEMLARLRDSGAVDVALARAHEYAMRARDALSTLPKSPARDELYALIDRVVERER